MNVLDQFVRVCDAPRPRQLVGGVASEVGQLAKLEAYVYAEPDIGAVYYLTIDPAGPRDCNPAWRNRGLSATLRAFNRR